METVPLGFCTYGEPRPTNPTKIRYEIGVATLVTDQRVINCWEIWLGGYAIVHRFDVSDPEQVEQAARWVAGRGRCFWRSGYEVRGAEDVLQVFGRPLVAGARAGGAR